MSRGWLAVFAAAVLCTPGQAAPPEKLVACLACHGAEGTSETVNVPSLGGQRDAYLLTQLFMFREGLRTAEPMNTFIKPFTDDDLRSAAGFFAKLPPSKPLAGPVDQARLQRGRALAETFRCSTCHSPDLSGQENVPRLAGQREDYTLKTLRDLKSGSRHGYEPIMAESLQPVDDAGLVELAYYISHLR